MISTNTKRRDMKGCRHEEMRSNRKMNATGYQQQTMMWCQHENDATRVLLWNDATHVGIDAPFQVKWEVHANGCRWHEEMRSNGKRTQQGISDKQWCSANTKMMRHGGTVVKWRHLSGYRCAISGQTGNACKQVSAINWGVALTKMMQRGGYYCEMTLPKWVQMRRFRHRCYAPFQAQVLNVKKLKNQQHTTKLGPDTRPDKVARQQPD